MNAYELADYLDNNVEAMLMSEQAYIDTASAMLRYLADKITELEKEVFVLHNAYTNRVLRTYDGKLND